jgi:hypothetical protein
LSLIVYNVDKVTEFPCNSLAILAHPIVNSYKSTLSLSFSIQKIYMLSTLALDGLAIRIYNNSVEGNLLKWTHSVCRRSSVGRALLAPAQFRLDAANVGAAHKANQYSSESDTEYA